MTSSDATFQFTLWRTRDALRGSLRLVEPAHQRALLDLADALDRIDRCVGSDGPSPAADAAANAARWTATLNELDAALAAILPPASTLLGDRTITDLAELRGAFAARLARMQTTHRGGSAGIVGTARAMPPAPPVADQFEPAVTAGAEPSVAGAAPAPAVEVGTVAPTAAGAEPGAGPATTVDAAASDNVSFTASAPAAARPGDEFVARFAAFLPQDDSAVRAALAEASPRARTAALARHGRLARGTEVEILLEATGLAITGAGDRPLRTFVWDGTPQIVEFDVAVPQDAAPRTVVMKFHFRVDGIALDRVALELEIGDAQAATAAPLRSATPRPLPARAFASYSSTDRPRVLDRVAAIRIAANIDVFLDCMDLNPSEAWEPRLSREIDQRELFLLFWSEAAAMSKWVTWEWEHALQTKGIEAMQIQPLDNGVKAPRQLRAVHMADPYVDLRQAELDRRADRALNAPPVAATAATAATAAGTP